MSGIFSGGWSSLYDRCKVCGLTAMGTGEQDGWPCKASESYGPLKSYCPRKPETDRRKSGRRVATERRRP